MLTAALLVACNVYNDSLLEETATSGDDGTLTSDSTSSSGTSTSAGSNTTSTSGGSGQGPTTGTPTTTGTTNTTDAGGGQGGGASGGTESSTSSSTDGQGGESSSADTNGTTSSTGTGGSATTSTSTVTSTTGTTEVDPLLVDDMEDGNNQLKRPTFDGYWYTAADETGSGEITPPTDDECTPTELDPARGDSTQAMHVFGSWSGGDDWAATVGFNFDNKETAVDASGYSGISFWVRTDDSGTGVRVQLATTGVEDTGYWEFPLDSLDGDWQQITLMWDEPLLLQPTWAVEVDFDPETLFKVQFQFDEGDFDLWIDDIRFVE